MQKIKVMTIIVDIVSPELPFYLRLELPFCLCEILLQCILIYVHLSLIVLLLVSQIEVSYIWPALNVTQQCLIF